MLTFPINPATENGNSTIPIASEVEQTECEKQCSSQQKALVSCVDSIRAANASRGDGSADGGSSAETPPCLPLAIAAWTKCCEDASKDNEQ